MENKKYDVRCMLKRDMPGVLDMGNKSFEFPWSEKDFLYVLSQRNHIGMVAVKKFSLARNKLEIKLINMVRGGKARRQS